jgi:hypothetical protein
MEISPTLAKVHRVLDAVASTPDWRDGGQELPKHLLWRLAALLDDSDVVYGAHDIQMHGNPVSGNLVLFTGDRVISATVAGLDQTTVETFPRSDLRSISIPSDEGRNVDQLWMSDANGWRDGRSVRLSYDGGLRLTLPLDGSSASRQARAFGDFLPSLLSDLTRRD